jgi:hypothetical protein
LAVTEGVYSAQASVSEVARWTMRNGLDEALGPKAPTDAEIVAPM